MVGLYNSLYLLIMYNPVILLLQLTVVCNYDNTWIFMQPAETEAEADAYGEDDYKDLQ